MRIISADEFCARMDQVRSVVWHGHIVLVHFLTGDPLVIDCSSIPKATELGQRLQAEMEAA